MEELKLNFIRPINGMLKFFLICGLWPAQSKYKWIYCIYATIFHFIFTLAYIYFKLVNLFIETDLRSLTVGFFIFLAEITLVVRVVNLCVNFDDILKCLSLVETFHVIDDNELQIVDRNLSLFSNLQTFYVSSGTISCLCSWGAIFFSSEPKLPYPAWYPIDWQTNRQSYWIAFSYQVVGTAFQAHGVVLLQLFSVYLMAIIGTQFDVLKYRLENLGQSIDETDETNHKETELKFVKCIKFHHQITRMVKIVEKLFMVPFFVQFVTTTVLLCCTAFQIAIMNIKEEMASFVYYITFAVYFIIEIFVVCYFGNEIILKYQNLSMAIYSSEWISKPTAYRKLIFMLLEMLNIPVALKTGNLFTVALDSFLIVINRSYSLLAVLQKTLNR